MSLISLAVTLIVIGVLLWLVNTYIPMDGKIKKILNVVVVVCVVVWLLFAFGILNHSGDIRVPRIPENMPRQSARNTAANSRCFPAGWWRRRRPNAGTSRANSTTKSARPSPSCN